jgi:hypothetical protein
MFSRKREQNDRAGTVRGHPGNDRLFWEKVTMCLGSLKNFGAQIVNRDRAAIFNHKSKERHPIY